MGKELTAFEEAQLAEMRRHNAAIEASLPKDANGAPTKGMFGELLAAAREKNASVPQPTLVPGCRSHLSEATFTAKINHQGIVAELVDYTYPPGCDTGVENGGRVPTGHPIGENAHKKWKWEIWRDDINAYTGKPLPQHMRPHPATEAVTGTTAAVK
jgi:hypothetical protein